MNKFYIHTKIKYRKREDESESLRDWSLKFHQQITNSIFTFSSLLSFKSHTMGL